MIGVIKPYTNKLADLPNRRPVTYVPLNQRKKRRVYFT